MSSKPLIWITRPEPDASSTAAEWREAGWETLTAPLMGIRHWTDRQAALDHLMKRCPRAMMATSRQAVEAACHLRLPPLPLHAAGERTAKAARYSGLFAEIVEFPAPATKTAASHFTKYPATPLLYLCGRHEAGDLTADLAPRGIEVLKLPVYEALLATDLPEEARRAIQHGRLQAIALYSQRAAAILRQLLLNAGLEGRVGAITLFCLSDAIAAQLAGCDWKSIEVAPSPTASAMIKKA